MSDFIQENLFYRMLDINFNGCYTNKKSVNKGMNCKTQKSYNGKVSVIITAFGEHYGKCLGSVKDQALASKVRAKLKSDKITVAEAIALLR